MELSTTVTYGPDTKGAQTRLVDLAHKIDPKFAQSVVDAIDDDPARLAAKRHVKERIELLEVRKSIGGNREDNYAERTSYAQLRTLAWLNLRSLNSGRLSTLKDAALLPMLGAACGQRLAETYYMYAWPITNLLMRRIAGASESIGIISSITDALMTAADFGYMAAREIAQRDARDAIAETAKSEPRTATMLPRGSREQGIEFIRSWIADLHSTKLVVCDPYFSLEDLELLKILHEEAADIALTVIANYALFSQGISPLSEEAVGSYWRTKLSDKDPPPTDFILLRLDENARFPIHDRWLLAQNSGLRLGTSYGGIGTRLSELSIMSAADVRAASRELLPYMTMEKKEFDGRRIRYTVLTL